MMKLRFAPSPTGLIHLGNARTALFNALLAKAWQGVFLLRIENSDTSRCQQHYVSALKEDLRWLGLNWQEGMEVGGNLGPYFQAQRQTIYDHYYQKLQAQNQVYPCFCSPKQLAISRQRQLRAGRPPRYSGRCRHLAPQEIKEKLACGLKPSLRFRVPISQDIVFMDLVKGEQLFKSDDMGDFIIRRADGLAPFLYCNAIDDALMAVTCVLRGEDHLTNTPRQLLILHALELKAPQYGHIPLIVGRDNAPLSKRNGSLSIADLRKLGYLPAAILNYMARLGHCYQQGHLMTFLQLADNFAIKNLSNAPACYDEKQLRYWQRKAVMALSDDEIAKWLAPLEIDLPKDKSALFFEVIRHNVCLISEAKAIAGYLFSNALVFDLPSQQIIKQAGEKFFKCALKAIKQHDCDVKTIAAVMTAQLNVKGSALFMPLRVAITGQKQGLELAVVFKLLGPTRLLKRLEQAIALLA